MEDIGKYKIVRVIGEGGMGRVYEAVDPVIGRRVAIKTISLNVALDAEVRARFFREAQSAGQLSHPNLITIHDIGEADGHPYIVMEYLEGADLSRTIRSERLPLETKMRIMIDLCEGLAFAHGRDVIHRDIKPANIFVTTQGRAKILDFGLARGALSEVTRTGKVVGTPHYMAPEQIRGDEIDHRADIFSAGVVFYELLSGRKAFDGDTVATTIYKVLQTHPEPISRLDAALPSELSAIVERAIAKDRTERFHTSKELLEALSHVPVPGADAHRPRTLAVSQAVPLTVPVASVPAPSREGPRVDWRVVAAVVVLAGIAGIAALTLSRQGSPADASPGQPEQVVAKQDLSEPLATQPVESAPPPAITPPDREPVRAAAGRTPALPARESPRQPPAPTPLPATSDPVVPAPASTSVAATPAAVQPIVSPPPPAVPAEPRPVPAETPQVAPPPAEQVPPAPVAPREPPPVSAEANASAAIQDVVSRYQAALESRDIGALKRIWPSLSGRQEEALRNEFQNARAIAVALDGVTVRTTGDRTTVIGRRNYQVTTADGRSLRTATRMTMTLSRRDGAWVIDAISHEAAQ